MHPGLLLYERFKILSLAASGGMGDVYRAQDLHGGAQVAIKVMRAHATQRERFLREMAVLETLEHPAIVRHLGHGEAPDGELWLAMEWLEGEELEARLERGGLTTDGALAVGRALASALAHGHARGIVHRDLKPSNVSLRGGDPARATLLDFGVARVEGAEHALTQTGVIIGTVGYMAPEQASGGVIDARADVFALGCVLFECLAGAPPFMGATPMALLAKLLLSDAPRVRALRPSVPLALDELVARMLARAPADRPADGSAVLAELAELDVRGSASLPPRGAALGLGRAEQRVVSVVVAELEAQNDPDAPTLAAEDARAVFTLLEEASARYPSRVASLGPTAVALVLEGRTSATDQALQAAAVALSLLDARGDLRVSVSTGRAETTSAGPSGPMIDHAVGMLAAFRAGAGPVIDDVTRALVEARFVVDTVGGVHRLASRRAEGGRLLLGRAIPCVGRDRELATLESALEESIEEGVARAVVVTGAPGIGKTRLVEDLVARAAARHPGLVVLVARAELLRTGSIFGLAGDLVAGRVASLGDQVDAYWSRIGLAAEAPFLRELAEPRAARRQTAERGGERSPEVAALRTDPFALRDAVMRAFEAWLDREAAAQPLLVVVEDLHWADASSVELLASAFRRASSRPLTILALARPEVEETYPAFARDLHAQVLRLSGLAKRALERLARAALGEGPSAEDIARIVALSDGNPFYLEELARWTSEGGKETLPESVVAMAQVRLGRLDEGARRALRACSVLGESFDAVSVGALTGEPSDVASILERLVRDEVLVERAPRRWAFRHALLRSAAYGMLTDVDRRAAHALAARVLAGERAVDPALVAEHFALGGESAEAVSWFLAAARGAFEAGDLHATLRSVARGLSLEPGAPEEGELRVLEASVLGMRGEWDAAGTAARRAMSLVGSTGARATTWFRAAATAVFSDVNEGRLTGTIEAFKGLVRLDVVEPTAEYGRAVAVIVAALALVGQVEMVEPLVDGLDRASHAKEPPAYTAYRALARCLLSVAKLDLRRALEEGRRAVELLPGIQDPMATVLSRVALSRALMDAGRYDDAKVELVVSEREADRTGMAYLRDWSRALRHGATVLSGRPDGVLEHLRAIQTDSLVVQSTILINFGNVALLEGDAEAAEVWGRQPLPAAGVRIIEAMQSSLLGRALLAQGRHAEALAVAHAALKKNDEVVSIGAKTWILAIQCEALAGLGRRDEAREVARAARARIRAIADSLEPDDRRAFLEESPPNVMTLRWARELLDEP